MRYFALFLFFTSCTSYALVEPPEFFIDDEKIICEAQDIPSARAVEWGGKRYILYNPDYMRKLPEDVQIWVYQHEYYHHLLNHSGRKFSEFKTLQMEADCFALAYIDTPAVREFIEDIRDVEDINGYCYGGKK